MVDREDYVAKGVKEAKFPFYVGRPQPECAKQPFILPSTARDRKREARAYIADEGLIDAVNVALTLGQPLLLTGEPGTGKTQLAFSLGCELGYEVYKYETKSTSTARDLFYTYDALGRFHAAQLREKGRLDGRDFISYNALGLAILRSKAFGDVADVLPRNFEGWEQPKRSVVLIDEIDKAPRDFPNDLLNELEEMYFKIPELGLTEKKITAHDEMRPVVVVTSNSEKGLPDAFLRRCIYYDIPFPEEHSLLNEIVISHLPSLAERGKPWLSEALDFFLKLRMQRRALEKRPSTAELLNWLSYLGRRMETGDSLRKQPELIKAGIGALLKTSSDRARAGDIFDEWVAEQV